MPFVGCGINPPTSEYLYAVDRLGNQVFEFPATSTGRLRICGSLGRVSTDQMPAGSRGRSLRPLRLCKQHSGKQNQRVHDLLWCEYRDSNGVGRTAACSRWRLAIQLDGKCEGPGPLVVDPFGNVYMWWVRARTRSRLFRISPISGSLAARTPATVTTGPRPTSIAIR